MRKIKPLFNFCERISGSVPVVRQSTPVAGGQAAGGQRQVVERQVVKPRTSMDGVRRMLMHTE